ncbi:DUF3987 domain-containing protein [Comamonas aquatica]|uniref:DUF3987 domain-containing protein n=1 Tax=Comamonas aquatica TaxID=225991 RepID=UPI0031330817
MRTARSRTSGENLFDLVIAPSSQVLEPPQNPGRFMVGSGAIPRMLISYATKAPAFFNLGAGERSNPFEHPFHDRVRELMTDYKDVLQGYADREQVTLSLQAQECLRHAVSVWKSLPLGDERWKGMDAFVHRAGEQAMRVAAVLQCFNDPLPTVQGVTMEAAVTLVDWHLEQALIGFGEPSEDQLQLELGAELYRYILKCRVPDDWLLKNKRPLLHGREVLQAVLATWQSRAKELPC